MMNDNDPSRGEIWLVDWSPSRGSEQSGMRSALVVQTDAASRNPRYPNVIVAAISTKGKDVPFHVPLAPEDSNGLSENSWCKCEQILTISKDRLARRLGRIDDRKMQHIEKALRLVLGLESSIHSPKGHSAP